MRDFSLDFDYAGATQEEKAAFDEWLVDHQQLDQEEQWIDDHIEEIFPEYFPENFAPARASAN